jgi:hypothetical protein
VEVSMHHHHKHGWKLVFLSLSFSFLLIIRFIKCVLKWTWQLPITSYNNIRQKKQNLSNLVCIKWINKFWYSGVGGDYCWPISSLFVFMIHDDKL